MRARTPGGQVYRISRRWALWRWNNAIAGLPNEDGTDDMRGLSKSSAGFYFVVGLVQLILIPLLIPIAVVARTYFGKPWMVQVRWTDMAREVRGGTWSESAELMRQLAQEVEQTGSLIDSPLFAGK